jgi:hypothetical protein
MTPEIHTTYDPVTCPECNLPLDDIKGHNYYHYMCGAVYQVFEKNQAIKRYTDYYSAEVVACPGRMDLGYLD